MDAVLAFFMPGMGEMLIIGVIALLLFGKRLPEVARSMGKGFIEFKRGLAGIETEVNNAVYSSPSSSASRPAPRDDRDEVSAPKFEPPASEPVDAETQNA